MKTGRKPFSGTTTGCSLPRFTEALTAIIPHLTGYADEKGGPHAEGLNLNLPLGPDSGDDAYLDGVVACLEKALMRNSWAIIMSLGFDALASDPARGLRVSEQAFGRVGELLGQVDLPLLLIQEGGYDVANLERVATCFLENFRLARKNG